MKKNPLLSALALTCATTLVACGGGEDPAPAPAPAASGQSVNGMLVVPLSITASTSAAVRRAGWDDDGRGARPLAYPGCPDVPDGYAPLAAVPIQFANAAGTVLTTLTTDTCGAFTGTVDNAATVATATPTGGSPVSQPVSSLITVAGAPASIVSSLPTGATYIISVVQDLGAGRVALTVSDSLTGKAVLGLTPADFAFTAASTPVALSSLNYGASQTLGNASVSVVLDSSGSMSSFVGTTNRSRYQVAALAAHELLNGLTTGADEANITLFSSTVIPINDAALATLSWVDPAGAAIPDYAFSVSGRTQNIASLRPVVDAYNPRSQIYRSNGTGPTTDPVHAATGNLRIAGSYPYSGNTAFYDGTIAGINALSSAVNQRKIVVSMTDGQENASRSTLATVVSTATSQGIPVFTVAFGTASSVDEVSMQRIADQTGGQYRRVEGTDLAGLFQGIQTGIRFQYVAALGAAQPSGTVLTITLNRGATPVVRTLTIQ